MNLGLKIDTDYSVIGFGILGLCFGSQDAYAPGLP